MIGSRARTRVSRFIIVATLAASLAVPATGNATAAGACLLGGSASFSPGLLYRPQFGAAATINGNLSLCNQAPDAGPAGGTLTMGTVYTDKAGYKWQEPLGVVQGGCLAAITRGTVIARWADGTVTVMAIDVHSVFSQLYITGGVLPGVTLHAVDAQEGQPGALVVNTTRYGVGSIVGGHAQVIGPEGAPITCAAEDATGLPRTTQIFFLGGASLADD